MALYIGLSVIVFLFQIDEWPVSYFPMYSWSNGSDINQYRLTFSNEATGPRRVISNSVIHQGYFSNKMGTYDPKLNKAELELSFQAIIKSRALREAHSEAKYIYLEKRTVHLDSPQQAEWKTLRTMTVDEI